MNYLLDTHAFLWFINDDPLLGNAAKRIMENPDNTLYLSIASIWEIALKVSIGKLDVPSPFEEFIDKQLQQNSILPLDIRLRHIGLLTDLPFHHRDPFDRLLIAQSRAEDLRILGKDAIFDVYGVTRTWE